MSLRISKRNEDGGRSVYLVEGAGVLGALALVALIGLLTLLEMLFSA